MCVGWLSSGDGWFLWRQSEPVFTHSATETELLWTRSDTTLYSSICLQRRIVAEFTTNYNKDVKNVVKHKYLSRKAINPIKQKHKQNKGIKNTGCGWLHESRLVFFSVPKYLPHHKSFPPFSFSWNNVHKQHRTNHKRLKEKWIQQFWLQCCLATRPRWFSNWMHSLYVCLGRAASSREANKCVTKCIRHDFSRRLQIRNTGIQMKKSRGLLSTANISVFHFCIFMIYSRKLFVPRKLK